MIASALFALAALLPASLATPIKPAFSNLSKRDLKAYAEEVTVHSSCNVTQTRQLRKALADTFELTAFAQEYVYRNGPSDPVYQLYFGDGDSVVVLGAYENLMRSNKEGVLLRCDDIDGNCVQDGWRGHWRGENATEETVICDLSYIDRKYNEQFCAFGYNVVNSSPSYYFSTDLMHRLFHLPSVGLGKIGHFADDHADCVNLAKTNGTAAVYNTHSLQYFANHVYAVEVAEGGEGCIGEYDSSGIVAPTTTSAAAASGTSSASSSCHTHSDGEVHCV